MARTDGTVGTEELKDITLALFNESLIEGDRKARASGAVGPQWLNVQLVWIESTMLLSATYTSKDDQQEKFESQ